MKTKIFLGFWALFLLMLNCYGQPTTFDLRYSSPMESEGFIAITQGVNGGYTALGGTYFKDDVWVVKINKEGQVEWDRDWGGNGSEFFEDIAPCQDGGFVFTGWTWSFSDSGEAHKLYLTKLGDSGNLEWEKVYGTGNGDKGFDIVQTYDGGYAVLGGSIRNNSYGFRNQWLLRTDAKGDTLWTKLIQHGYSHSWGTIIETPDQGFLIGNTIQYSNTTAGNDSTYHYLIRTDGNGDTLWTKAVSHIYDPKGNFRETNDILITHEGHYLIGARHAVFLMDDSGNLLWINYENGAKGVAQLNDGHFVGLTGNKISKFHRDTGDTLWVKYNDEIEGHDVVAADDGGFLMAGAKWYPDSYRDGRIIKVDCEGNVVNPVVCHPVAIDPEEIALSIQVYPNPVQGALFIDFPAPQSAELSLFDMLGREVLSVELGSGINQVRIPKGVSGMHLYRVQNREGVMKDGKILIRK